MTILMWHRTLQRRGRFRLMMAPAVLVRLARSASCMGPGPIAVDSNGPVTDNAQSGSSSAPSRRSARHRRDQAGQRFTVASKRQAPSEENDGARQHLRSHRQARADRHTVVAPPPGYSRVVVL